MENNEKLLEEKAKKLISLKVKEKPEGINLSFTLNGLEENMPELNYLVREGYIIEKGYTVQEFCYEVTPYGKRWALE